MARENSKAKPVEGAEATEVRPVAFGATFAERAAARAEAEGKTVHADADSVEDKAVGSGESKSKPRRRGRQS